MVMVGITAGPTQHGLAVVLHGSSRTCTELSVKEDAHSSDQPAVWVMKPLEQGAMSHELHAGHTHKGAPAT